PMFAALNWKSITSSSGSPFNSCISSPRFSPIRSATDPGSTASTRSFWPSAPLCAGALRYSWTAFLTYADAENCFLVLLIGRPFSKATNKVVQAGECGHQAGHIKKDIELGHTDMPPVDIEHREHSEHLHRCAGFSVRRRRESAPADHENDDGRYQHD